MTSDPRGDSPEMGPSASDASLVTLDPRAGRLSLGERAWSLRRACLESYATAIWLRSLSDHAGYLSELRHARRYLAAYAALTHDP